LWPLYGAETDLLGEKEVPADALYGIATQRAVVGVVRFGYSVGVRFGCVDNAGCRQLS
jgi:hypothetical protein